MCRDSDGRISDVFRSFSLRGLLVVLRRMCVSMCVYVGGCVCLSVCLWVCVCLSGCVSVGVCVSE